MGLFLCMIVVKIPPSRAKTMMCEAGVPGEDEAERPHQDPVGFVQLMNQLVLKVL